MLKRFQLRTNMAKETDEIYCKKNKKVIINFKKYFCMMTFFAILPFSIPASASSDMFSSFMSDVVDFAGPSPFPDAKLQVKAGDKMAFMGDSITAFGGYHHLIAQVFKTQYPELPLPAFINAGRGGHKAEDMIARFEKDMKLAEKPEWIFINAGINDVAKRMGNPHDPAVLENYKTNVMKMIELGQMVSSHVVLLTPTVLYSYSPKAETNQRLSLYVDAMKQIAKQKKCDLIDLHALFLNIGSKQNTSHPLHNLTYDGVHMATAGDALMAITILRFLGVPDSKIAATDITPIIKIRGANMTISNMATILDIPVSRFAKPELAHLFIF